MVAMRASRVAYVMAMAASAAWAQPCSTHVSHSDCEGQVCENGAQYCVWDVTAGACGCPDSCSAYSGLNHELCLNSACPWLLPDNRVMCEYNDKTEECSCPKAAETAAPAQQGCGKHGTRDTCEGDICANGVQYCVWDVTAGACGCPDSCSDYSGLNPELCLNSACPWLLPNNHVMCEYNDKTEKCSCPKVEDTAAPATPVPTTRAPPTPAPTTAVPETPAPAPRCETTTLVVNPSFEVISGTTNIGNSLNNGQMQGWTASHGTPSVFGGAPGQGLRSAWMWSHNGIGEGIVTNVPLTGGRPYRVTMWVLTNNPDGQFFVKAANALVPTAGFTLPSNGGEQTLYSNGLVFQNEWTEITFDFTATQQFAQLWIYVFHGGPAVNGQAELRVDNIRVCDIGTDAPATPAPTTLAPPTRAPLPPTPAPPIERCEELSFSPKACLSTLCPEFVQIGKKVACAYNFDTNRCSCPEKVSATPWPVIADDCSSFHGSPRMCASSVCSANGKKAECSYDWEQNTCSCRG